MIQTIKGKREKTAGERFGDAFVGVGQEVGKGIAEHYEAKANKKSMEDFADKLIKNNPNSPMHKTIADIYRSDMPIDDKTQIVNSLIGIDPFKADQQRRLEQDMMRKVYQGELDNIVKQINATSSPALKAPLQKQYGETKAKMDAMFFDRKDEEMGDDNDNEDDDDDEDIDELRGPKVKFDPENEKHRKIAEKLMTKYNDTEKVRKSLKKNFKF